MEALLLEIALVMGVGTGTAFRVYQLIMAGASTWALISMIIAGGGFIGIGIVALRYAVKKWATKKLEDVAVAY
ncbi:uberolysin/carnocyclin family circular bacteriocin [Paenibacillus arenilitoris]|uniref:Uberolysin/carnocyclin family circular bacteriocin n=1 Tax=Paenibacillus arenilitoris TaxID=2772299 RepID=A0A927CIY3_9BACL|nr:uberolysin/carnocyclin family circular bacteriocin [Paenibacillus arenilitoris]MBD2867036.1 uberolysin/carnocyclin family circular bacteriocin [Paenibacillus arenilitoris]